MKHIKYLHERRTNQETEFDLRGLGETSAIRAEYPQTHLSVITKNAELVHKCAALLSLDVRKSKKHEDVFHMFSPRHDLNHKEKSIILFGASMYISRIDGNAQMLMNEISQLVKLIKEESIIDAEDSDENLLNWMKDSHHLSMHPGMQFYLHQAGFNIQPKGEFQQFKPETLELLRTHSSQEKSYRLKSVVGE